MKDQFSQVTEVELVYRNKMRPAQRPQINSSIDAYELFYRTWDHDKIEIQEQFRVMFLDRKNSVLGISTVATGGTTMCVADPKIVFAMALKAGATGIIIAHNHPSGSLHPSCEDKAMTARFLYAGSLLELPMIDHLIVTNEGYTSFQDEGLIPRQDKCNSGLALLFPRKSHKKELPTP